MSAYSQALSLIEERQIDVGSMIKRRYTSLDAVQGRSRKMRSPNHLKSLVVL